MFGIHGILETYGVISILVIIFCETAFPVCFFFPGDTLLFSAGILASTGILSLPMVILVTFIAATGGGITGFLIGRGLGNRFLKENTISPKMASYKHRAQHFYQTYGIWAVLIGRFVPIVRTFMSGLAGAASMKSKTFYITNAIGALLWSVIVPILGFFLGRKFPSLIHYMVYVVAGVVVVSFIPLVVSLYSSWRRKKQERNQTMV